MHGVHEYAAERLVVPIDDLDLVGIELVVVRSRSRPNEDPTLGNTKDSPTFDEGSFEFVFVEFSRSRKFAVGFMDLVVEKHVLKIGAVCREFASTFAEFIEVHRHPFAV
jgi:hypothetical protein